MQILHMTLDKAHKGLFSSFKEPPVFLPGNEEIEYTLHAWQICLRA